MSTTTTDDHMGGQAGAHGLCCYWWCRLLCRVLRAEEMEASAVPAEEALQEKGEVEGAVREQEAERDTRWQAGRQGGD